MHLVESIPEQMQTRWQARSIGSFITILPVVSSTPES